MNSRCAIAAWLECVQEKPSSCRNEHVCQGRKINVKLLSGPTDWILRYIKRYLYHTFIIYVGEVCAAYVCAYVRTCMRTYLRTCVRAAHMRTRVPE